MRGLSESELGAYSVAHCSYIIHGVGLALCQIAVCFANERASDGRVGSHWINVFTFAIGAALGLCA